MSKIRSKYISIYPLGPFEESVVHKNGGLLIYGPALPAVLRRVKINSGKTPAALI